MPRWRDAARVAAVLTALLAEAGGGPREAGAQISPGDLSRAHRELDGPLKCMSCHGGRAEEMNANCTGCHADIAELVRLGRGLHARVAGEDCAGCHPEHAGRDFELIAWDEGAPAKFDHARAGWPLAGGHAEAACRDCHRSEFRVSPVAALSKRSDPDAGWVGLETECASCHRDPHGGALGTGCASCHGVQAFRPATAFDHARSAFPLTGKHAAVECARCHLPPGVEPARDEAGRPVPVYKPLAHAECSACHRDPHEGRLGPGCAECHTPEGFRLAAAPGAFDHAATRYPLRGRHALLECRACHDPERAWGRRPAFDRCDACHADAHAGAATLAGRPADCAACHDENSFARATYTVEQHRGAAYALEGRHADVPCRDCHLRLPAGGAPTNLGTSGVLLRPPHGACRDCHADAHGGQLAGRTGGQDCAGCHGVDAFRPSRFGPEDHASLRLPLEGRHREIRCEACHGPQRPGLPPLPGPEVTGPARVLLALPETTCASCHRDPHDGRFRAPEPTRESAPAGRSAAGGALTDAAACSSCHGTERFRPSRVDVVRHRDYDFALEGAHQAVPCSACHAELEHEPVTSTLVAADAPLPALPFDQHRSACADCHEDPHGGQFVPPPDDRGCARCHGQETFRPATAFDHDRDTEFALRGAHARLACSSCHATAPFPDGRLRARYRPTPRDCIACHRDIDPSGEARRNPASLRGQR